MQEILPFTFGQGLLVSVVLLALRADDLERLLAHPS